MRDVVNLVGNRVGDARMVPGLSCHSGNGKVSLLHGADRGIDGDVPTCTRFGPNPLDGPRGRAGRPWSARRPGASGLPRNDDVSGDHDGSLAAVDHRRRELLHQKEQGLCDPEISLEILADASRILANVAATALWRVHGCSSSVCTRSTVSAEPRLRSATSHG